MPWVDVSLFGSFQRGFFLTGENPLEEIWARLEHIGTTERLRSHPRKTESIDWAMHVDYACTRIRQAVDFRDAARVASPLTSPVSAYYGMLNLLRAVLAIGPEVLATPSHGLKFVSSSDLFSCAAEPTKGTFTDYLDSLGEVVPTHAITLGRCLREIVELAQNIAESTNLAPTLVAPANIQVWKDGKVEIAFMPSFVESLRSPGEWERAFPDLMADCAKEHGEPTLRTKIVPDQTGTSFASAFCERHFISDLKSLPHARWYAIRRSEGAPLPRPASYLVAMYILSNVCRYEPNRLRDALTFASEGEWMIRRFLAVADRYFPQLMLSWLYGRTVITGAA